MINLTIGFIVGLFTPKLFRIAWAWAKKKSTSLK